VLAGVAADAGAGGVGAGRWASRGHVAALRGDLLDTRDQRVTFRVLAVLAVMGFSMLLAYVDESGDPGTRRGATATFALGCVLVEADEWPKAFERFLAFRRRLRDQFKLLLKDEVKASYLLHDAGNLRRLGLSFDQKREIYERHMDLVPTLPAETFAILIEKAKHPHDDTPAITRRAWLYLAQRLQRACGDHGTSLMVIHDEGQNDEVRRYLRRARRDLRTGSGYGPGWRALRELPLVDDPVPRKSHHSYFTQMADLVAYAGYRHAFPPAKSCVCTEATWLRMGQGIRLKVNGTFGVGDGIVRG
jgi:hypothetical protein